MAAERGDTATIPSFEHPNDGDPLANGPAKDGPSRTAAAAAVHDKDVATYQRDVKKNGGPYNVADLQGKYSGSGDAAAGAPEAKAGDRTDAPAATAAAASHTNRWAVRSLLYVREEKKTPAAGTATRAPAETEEMIRGTKMRARLLSAVSSDLDVDVIAQVEYAYLDEAGNVVIPAGSKAYGRVSQYRRNGHIRLDFTSVRKPDGEEIPIRGVGVALNGRGPLLGHVGGKNTGKKILAKTASGLGAAATMLFGRSGGFSGPLTYGDIARERVASNILNEGETAAARMAYQELIVVTLPSNLRFDILLIGDTKLSPSGK